MNRKGKLTIFTGYSPGVGKTYIMLKEAYKQYGDSVVIGFLNQKQRRQPECYGKEGDSSVRYSIEDIVTKYKKSNYVVVMDEMGMSGRELTHRSFIYEDIERILEEGIDVYTSTNLKRFKEINSLFKSISGIGVKKTIPDYFLEIAERIVFVDRKPELLEQAYNSGKLFDRKNQNSNIMRKNFQINILREYRNISFDILKKYGDKVEITENNYFEKKGL